MNGQVESDITMNFVSPSTITLTVSQIIANVHMPGGMLSVHLSSLSVIDTETQAGMKQFVKTEQRIGFDVMFLGSPSWAPFTGTGTLFSPIDASASTSFTSTACDGCASAQTQVVSVELQYFFVPEPCSFALVVVGGGCLIWARSLRAPAPVHQIRFTIVSVHSPPPDDFGRCLSA
jgi:hypothetical protein